MLSMHFHFCPRRLISLTERTKKKSKVREGSKPITCIVLVSLSLLFPTLAVCQIVIYTACALQYLTQICLETKWLWHSIWEHLMLFHENITPAITHSDTTNITDHIEHFGRIISIFFFTSKSSFNDSAARGIELHQTIFGVFIFGVVMVTNCNLNFSFFFWLWRIENSHMEVVSTKNRQTNRNRPTMKE